MANFADHFASLPSSSDPGDKIGDVRQPARDLEAVIQEPSFDPLGGIGALAFAGAPGRFRLPISYRGIASSALALDFLIILAAAVISDEVYHFDASPMPGELSRTIGAATFVGILFIFATRVRKLYEPARLTNWNEQFQVVLGTWCGAFLLLASGVFAWGVGKELSRGTILLFWAIGGVSLLANCVFWRLWLPSALAKGTLKGRNAIILTWDERLTTPFAKLVSRHGYFVIDQFVVGSDLERTMATLKRVVDIARGTLVDDIFLVPNSKHELDVGTVVDSLRILAVPVTLIPDAATAELVESPRYDLGSILAIEIQRLPLSPLERGLKRAFDIVAASAGLVFFLPLFIVVAIATALEFQRACSVSPDAPRV